MLLKQPRHWAMDATTDQGKAQLSGLLSMGKKIVVHGTGNCEVHAERETVNYFYIQE